MEGGGADTKVNPLLVRGSKALKLRSLLLPPQAFPSLVALGGLPLESGYPPATKLPRIVGPRRWVWSSCLTYLHVYRK